MRPLWTLAFILICAAAAEAQAPERIAFQGKLTNSTSQPLNGTFLLSFRLYSTPAGVGSLWSETQSVPVVAGIFSVYLGDVTPLTGLAFDVGYWVSVEVATDGEMLPRFRLGTSAFSIRSRIANALEGLTVTLAELNRLAGSGATVTGANLTTLTNGSNADALHSHAWSSVTGIPAGFADGTDDNTTYAPGNGIAIAGTTISLSTAGAVGGNVLKFNGTTWGPALDADTNSGGTVTQINAGLGLTGGPVTTSGTLSIASAGITSAMLGTGVVQSQHLATDSVTTGSITDGNVTPAKIATFPRVSARMGGNITVATGTQTPIPWDIENYDTASMHSPASNTQFTAPLAGYYRCHAGIIFQTSTTGTREMLLKVNGVVRSAGARFYGAASVSEVTVDATILLNAGDIVSFDATQNSGITITSFNGAATYASVELVP